MNLAEIQKAASDAYLVEFRKAPDVGLHERGIAAVVAAVAQAVLAPALKCELSSLWNHAVDMRMQTDWAWIINELLERRLETLLKPADERVAVVRQALAPLGNFGVDESLRGTICEAVLTALDAMKAPK